MTKIKQTIISKIKKQFKNQGYEQSPTIQRTEKQGKINGH